MKRAREEGVEGVEGAIDLTDDAIDLMADEKPPAGKRPKVAIEVVLD